MDRVYSLGYYAMKNIGEVLGYIVVAYIYIAVVASQQFNSEVTQTSTHSNTTHIDAKAFNPGEEEEDDFVPYRGEHSNVFDWRLLRVITFKAGNLKAAACIYLCSFALSRCLFALAPRP